MGCDVGVFGCVTTPSELPAISDFGVSGGGGVPGAQKYDDNINVSLNQMHIQACHHIFKDIYIVNFNKMLHKP
jgi:hypothetical protein